MGHYIVVMVHPYLLLRCATVTYFCQIELGQIIYKRVYSQVVVWGIE